MKLFFTAGLEKMKLKKGFMGFGFELMGYVVGVTAVVIFLSSILLSTLREAASTHDLEYFLAHARVTYSGSGFFYTDKDTGRAYPGMIVPGQYKEETLKQLFGDDPANAQAPNIPFADTRKFALKFSYDGNILFYNRELFETAEYVYQNPEAYYNGIYLVTPVTVGQHDTALQQGMMFITE
ncbi:hypothetical protein HYU14_01020 [Candidatus Woesearchaeota archaeon]|nr:hypothetical protein [Candidatus Woesearchaeota archaeon]